jgi:hypothetical protein
VQCRQIYMPIHILPPKIQKDFQVLQSLISKIDGEILAADKFARLPVRLGTSGFGVVPKLTGLKVAGVPVF